MAASYLDMQNAIADEVRDSATAASTDIETRIQNAILRAIKFYERRRFYFNQTTNTFATVAAQEYYGTADLADIPNLITIDSMTLTLSDGVSKLPIEIVTFDSIDAWQDGRTTGDPCYAAYYKQQIRLAPIPTAVRTVNMAYHYRLTALSSASDSNAWTTDGEELIRNRAAAEIWDKIVKEDARADRCRIWEQQALDAIVQETKNRRSSPALRTDEVAALDRRGRFGNIYSGRAG